jgi:hypothetical protein
MPAAAARSTAWAPGDVPSNGPSMKLLECTTMSGRRATSQSTAARKSWSVR